MSHWSTRWRRCLDGSPDTEHHRLRNSERRRVSEILRGDYGRLGGRLSNRRRTVSDLHSAVAILTSWILRAGREALVLGRIAFIVYLEISNIDKGVVFFLLQSKTPLTSIDRRRARFSYQGTAQGDSLADISAVDNVRYTRHRAGCCSSVLLAIL